MLDRVYVYAAERKPRPRVPREPDAKPLVGLVELSGKNDGPRWGKIRAAVNGSDVTETRVTSGLRSNRANFAPSSRFTCF